MLKTFQSRIHIMLTEPTAASRSIHKIIEQNYLQLHPCPRTGFIMERSFSIRNFNGALITNRVSKLSYGMMN